MNTVNIYATIQGVPARSYHHGALHEALLETAFEQARKQGPQAIQVRALAKRAGVSPSAIYRHVPNIETLLAEVSQQARQELAVRLIRARDSAPQHRTRKAAARARFRAMGRGYIDFALDEPHLFDTAFMPNSAPLPRSEGPSAWEVLVEGVQELVDAGVIEAPAAADAALIAWSGVHGIASILARRVLVEPMDDDNAINVVQDAVMRSIESL